MGNLTFNRSGYHEIKFLNGDFYKGEWLNGKMHGEGTMYYFDGNIHKGTWVE